jgi:hypothetical protein
MFELHDSQLFLCLTQLVVFDNGHEGGIKCLLELENLIHHVLGLALALVDRLELVLDRKLFYSERVELSFHFLLELATCLRSWVVEGSKLGIWH